MAYACNYGGVPDDWEPKNVCDLREMQHCWDEMKYASNNPGRHALGWWYERDWAKTYGWDIRGTKVCENMWDYGEPKWQFREECENGVCRRINGYS